MDNLTELPTTAQPSLLLLNEYCLLELFDILKFKDSMNLAETCVYFRAVADRTFRKYSTMKLDDQMAENGKECIDRFFTRFGHRVLALEISSPWDKLDCWRIVRNCENLKVLQMRGISCDFENIPPLFTIDNLEVLLFVECDEEFIKSCLNIVCKVKALSLSRCRIQCNTLMRVFTNSPDMESFELWCDVNDRFDFHLLEIISNVQRLYLQVKVNNVSELDPLITLNRLSKLRLRCRGENITSFLSELAKKGIIQELELRDVAFDENFFEVLKSLDSLQLLVLHNDFFRELKSSMVWPPKLKRFRLTGFIFTLDAFLPPIKQLKHLESICIYHCHIVEGEEDNFNDVKELSRQILTAIDNGDRKERLNVALPWRLNIGEGSSEKFVHDSERLRIYSKNYISKNIRLDISKSFPGM